eukprot:COSAG06_NODE_27433_length_593_cov_1.109312_2_plen_29_part_01
MRCIIVHKQSNTNRHRDFSLLLQSYLMIS